MRCCLVLGYQSSVAPIGEVEEAPRNESAGCFQMHHEHIHPSKEKPDKTCT